MRQNRSDYGGTSGVNNPTLIRWTRGGGDMEASSICMLRYYICLCLDRLLCTKQQNKSWSGEAKIFTGPYIDRRDNR